MKDENLDFSAASAPLRENSSSIASGWLAGSASPLRLQMMPSFIRSKPKVSRRGAEGAEKDRDKLERSFIEILKL